MTDETRAGVAGSETSDIGTLVASSASERQQTGGFLENAGAFDLRHAALGFGDLDLLPALRRLDVSF